MAKRIVILGGGVSGIEALKSIHTHFHEDTRASILVIDKKNYSTFTPMLHEVATGAVQADDIVQPIRNLVHCCLERFLLDEVVSIDIEQKTIKTKQEEVKYDYLVIALGAVNNFFGVPGAEEYALKLKTMDDAILLRNTIIDRFEEATKVPKSNRHRSEMLHFILVGGGYTGVETAGQMADLFHHELRKLYPEIGPEEPKITLVQGNDRILPILAESSSLKSQKKLEQLGVEVLTSERVTAVTKEGVTLRSGKVLSAHTVVWTSGVRAIGEEILGKAYTEKGRIKVTSTLQIPGHPEVFAIGDIAAVMEGGGPHPQTAQAGVQQAKLIGPNLAKLLSHEPLEPFVYKHKGDLVPIGNRWAISEISGLKFSGFLAWWIRRTVYLLGIASWADRVRVVFSWTINLFTDRDTTRL